MVNCSHCGIEIKREVFCSPSHKVMYHRQLTNGKQPEVVLTKGKQQGDVSLPKVNTVSDTIYHGTWLCKKHQSFTCSCTPKS